MSRTLRKKKFIHEGKYVAEVEVRLVVDETEWAPYLELEDAYRLDAVREALRNHHLKEASRLAKVYELHPVAI